MSFGPHEVAAARQWVAHLFPHNGKTARSSINAMGCAHPYNARAAESIERADRLAAEILDSVSQDWEAIR